MSAANSTSIPAVIANSSSTAPAISSYLVYVGIAENVVCFIALSIAFPIMFRLLLDAYIGRTQGSKGFKRTIRISRSMAVFLVAHLVFGLLSMPSYVYNVGAELWPEKLLDPVRLIREY